MNSRCSSRISSLATASIDDGSIDDLNTGQSSKIYSDSELESHRFVSSSDQTNGDVPENLDLSIDQFRELERTFDEADEEGNGALNAAQFQRAMRAALGQETTDRELDMLFMKVDTNCDGTVDWDEYLSYMMFEYKGREKMGIVKQPPPFPNKPRLISELRKHMRNEDTITKTVFVPNTVKCIDHLHRVTDPLEGQYLTASRHGVLSLWTLHMEHEESQLIACKAAFRKNMKLWVTDVVWMTNLRLLALASTTGKLTFYEVKPGCFSIVAEIIGLEIVATCLEYWYDLEVPYRAKLIWGDARGNISGLIFSAPGGMKFLQPFGITKINSVVRWKSLLNREKHGVQAYHLSGIHANPVLKVAYIPHLNGFMSCAKSGETSLFFGDLEGKKAVYFSVTQGVNAFAYCKKANVFITGGRDDALKVWNPYIPQKPVMALHGRSSDVVLLLVNEQREHIISITRDNHIDVIDMASQAIIEKLDSQDLAPRTIATAYFNEDRQALIVANNKLCVFEHKHGVTKTLPQIPHMNAVNVVLYNELFSQVVSAGAESLVCVWNVKTGEQVMQFTAHTAISRCKEVGVEVVNMTFDSTQRRLLTAARNGSMKVWNFNNGECFREFKTDEAYEVTGLVWNNHKIFAAGWNRQITTFMDTSLRNERSLKWAPYHQDDILHLALLTPGTLASSSYDGDIVIWCVDTRRAKNRFNPFISNKACPTTWTSEGLVPDSKNNREKHGPETAVDKLICLSTRPTSKETANLVSVCGCGWIRFWSTDRSGGLLGQFNAAHYPGESVVDACTDPDNLLLFTGDSEGYLKTWSIGTYCLDQSNWSLEEKRHRTQLIKSTLRNFPLLKEHRLIRESATPKQEKCDPPPQTSRPDLTWKAPSMVNSFRAHVGAINNLLYLHDKQRLITSSRDNTIRLWTVQGTFVGIFGDQVPWKQIPIPVIAPKRNVAQKLKALHQLFRTERMPRDIRKVASTATFRVLRSMESDNKWQLTAEIICESLVASRKKKKKVTRDASVVDVINRVKYLTMTEKEVVQGYMEGEDERPPRPRENAFSTDFKSNRRHKPRPTLPAVSVFANKASVYSTLPYFHLDPPRYEKIVDPQSILQELDKLASQQIGGVEPLERSRLLMNSATSAYPVELAVRKETPTKLPRLVTS